MDGAYFSHQPLLAAAMQITSGPVLELGAGFGSTLMLHGLCGIQKRQLVTLESNGEWLDKFKHLERPWHVIRRIDSFYDLSEYYDKWGLAFVDHGIAGQRGHSVSALHNAEIIIAHDTCYYWLYNYEPILSEFKFRWDYKSNPKTTIVSNIIDVNAAFEGTNL